MGHYFGTPIESLHSLLCWRHRYGSNGGKAFPVFTYVALPVKLASPALPSRRYRDLLVRLASENGLSEAYHDWLRSQSCLDTDDVRMPVPTPEEAQRRFGPQELEACSYNPFSPQATPGGVARAVLVTMGGQVFDLGAHTVARAPGPREPMLRNMALMQDGTAFVLDILSRAYPEQGGVGGGDGGSSLASLNEMQRGYVAAWTQFLVSNACPRVGVLDGYEILLEAGYTPPLHSTTPGPTTPSTPSVLLEEAGVDVDEIAADRFGVALATRLKGLGIVNG